MAATKPHRVFAYLARCPLRPSTNASSWNGLAVTASRRLFSTASPSSSPPGPSRPRSRPGQSGFGGFGNSSRDGNAGGGEGNASPGGGLMEAMAQRMETAMQQQDPHADLLDPIKQDLAGVRRYPNYSFQPPSLLKPDRLKTRLETAKSLWPPPGPTPKAKQIGPTKRMAITKDPFVYLEGVDPVREAMNPHILGGRGMMDLGRIAPRVTTGFTRRTQRRYSKAVRRARNLGILPLWGRPVDTTLRR